MRRSFLSLITLTALALALAPSATAQGTVGTVSGTIRERGTERPLAGVQVRVVGTQRGALSDATGNYRIAGIPAGTVQLSAQQIGYAPQARTVTRRRRAARRWTSPSRRPSPRSIRSSSRRPDRASGGARAAPPPSTIESSADHDGGGQHLLRRAQLARAGRGRAVVRRRERRGHPRAHPRLELHLALQRAAAHRRRRAARQHAGVVADRRRRPVPVAHQRHQPRRHREHRGHQGTGGRGAVRHRRGERRAPGDDEEGTRRPDALGRLRRDGLAHRHQRLSGEPPLVRPFGQRRAAHELQPVRAHDRQLRRRRLDDLQHPDQVVGDPAGRQPPPARRERHRRLRGGHVLHRQRVPEGAERRAEQRAPADEHPHEPAVAARPLARRAAQHRLRQQRAAAPAERQQLVRRRLRLDARERGELRARPGGDARQPLQRRHGLGELRLLQPRHQPVRLLQHRHAPERAAAHRRPHEQLDAAQLAHRERDARRGHQPSRRHADASPRPAARRRSRRRKVTAASTTRTSSTTRAA